MKKTVLIVAVLSGSILASCSKDDSNTIVINTKTPIVLNYEKTLQIDASSEREITYESENVFHATVSNEGLITGGRVGETNVVVSNGKNSKMIPITIEPKYNLYETPCIDWGISKNDIIAKYGKPSNESGNIIGYSDYSMPAPLAMYIFDDNNKLKGSAVIVKMSYSNALTQFLIERYITLDVNSNGYIAMLANEIDNTKITTAITLSLYNISYLEVIYMDVRDALSSTRSINNKTRENCKLLIESMILK